MSDKSLDEDVNSIVRRPRIKKRPSINPAPREAKPASVGRGVLSVEGSGAGIDSPLTEQSRITVDFEVFDDFNVWSTVVQVATKIVMTDASRREVVFNYTDPNPEEAP